MNGKYKIAGHVFMVYSLYENIHKLCENYKSDEPSEFKIESSIDEINDIKIETIKECEKDNVSLAHYTDPMYEVTLIQKKIVETLFRFDTLLIHGSTISVDNEAFMFIAKSGTGKSTHSRMWRELLGEKAVMVNDDKPFIKIDERGVTAIGNPWNGKHHLGNNITVPLKGICILRRGVENSIREVSFKEAYPMIIQQLYRMPNKEDLKREMKLIDNMARAVKFYDMSCNISHEAAEMAYKFMHKGEL